MNSTIFSHTAHFSWVDHTMFVLMLVVSTVVGVLIGVCGKQDTKVDYLLGGKKMSVLPISMSLIFSHFSAVSFVGFPTEYYTYGTMIFNQVPAGLISCVFSLLVFLPIFFELQVTSTYEYLELRFHKNVRKMASFLYAFSVIIYLPLVVYVPALAFNEVSGLSEHLVTFVVCSVCVLYTMLGGMKAVVWTDFLQSFVTVGSCVAIICIGLVKVGGVGTMWDRSDRGGRLQLFDLNPDPFRRNTFWTIVIGNSVLWMSNLGVNQGMVQKFIALPTLKKARLSLVIFYVGYLAMKTFCLLIGLIMYATYYKCDPIASHFLLLVLSEKIFQQPMSQPPPSSCSIKPQNMYLSITSVQFPPRTTFLQQVNKADKIVPYFAMDTASEIPGLPGLFVAGIFSACLSTMSSNLNCLSATIFEDFISPWTTGNKFFESKTPLILKGIVVIIGAISLLMVLAVEKMGAIMQVGFTVAGVSAGATLGMFCLGMFVPWANWKGCLAGSIASLVATTWIATGAHMYKANGVERFPYLPTSTEGCEEIYNITVPATPAPTLLPEGMGDDAFPLYKISFHYYCLVGTFIVLVVGVAVSYFTGFQDPKTVDSRLLVPFLKKYGHSRESDAQHPSEKEMFNLKTENISNGRKNSRST